MSLQDLLDTSTLTKCSGCSWYSKLSEEDQKTFDQWVELWREKKLSFRKAYDACTKYGYELSEKALRDHVHNHHAR